MTSTRVLQFVEDFFVSHGVPVVVKFLHDPKFKPRVSKYELLVSYTDSKAGFISHVAVVVDAVEECFVDLLTKLIVKRTQKKKKDFS